LEDQDKENNCYGDVVISVDKECPEDMSPLTDSSAASILSISSSSNSSKQSRLNSRQASAARLHRKQEKESYKKRYNAAFKEATNQLAEEVNTEPVKEMLERLNDKHELKGDEGKMLTRSTIYRHTKAGRAGVSPVKMGPPSKVPTILVELLATHAEVAQVSQGELSGKDVRRLIEASVHGTAFEDQFKTTTVWKKVLLEYPNSLQAANKISVEDARSQWTTHDNLDNWFDDAKLDLIKSGLVRDVLVLDGSGKVESELDFRGEDVKGRIINMDETHHDLSITGDKQALDP
jgi:hypothetical protein